MAAYVEQDKELIFALDIGTRSIVGVVGRLVKDRFKVLAVESAEYSKRTMLDGQIDDISGVAALARAVTERLEQKLEVQLKRVCVAAAGRALRTQRGVFGMDLPEERTINANDIGEMEAGAVGAAEEALGKTEDLSQQFYLVGYTVAQYRLDNYPLNTLLGHNGKHAEVEIVATFLPGEVVDSLYSAMQSAQLQVASMTLEPIAAMNAAIPAELRLLNLALVDIGAGTSDIALCRDGSIVGYTMVTQAGDEITETIMRAFLVDFQTAEYIKRAIVQEQLISYTNILGLEERVSVEEVQEVIREPMERLADAIAQQILDINGGAPSALFLAGGGSKLVSFKSKMAAVMGMEERRVALVGSNFAKSAFSEEVDLNNPEYATPLGIAISAGMGLLNDSYVVKLNGHTAKLFRNGSLNLRDILLMNGYSYTDLVGRTGQNLSITLDGRRMMYRGEPAAPAILRVNGEDAVLTTLIHAGDQIDFVPARNGENAEKTLADILGEDFVGRVLVNNEEAPLTTKLHHGDTVLTLRKIVVPKTISVPVAERGTAEHKEIAEKLSEEHALPITEEKASHPVSVEEGQEKRQNAATFSHRKELSIFFNDEPFLLPGKESGEAYYLMDLLEYSGIDFKKLDRRVRMEVNGVECGFQTALRQGDHVLIRPE
ncbi:MAG: rod shape-determining protein [Oscillospiraceae bacterium]|nr:rod shape-determining protein [Oscillospiraceae bacterium]